jgi:short-subunit dehydrogenase
LEQPEEEFEKQMNVNYMGCVYLIKKVLPQMIKREIPCHIILTGSAVSFCTFLGYSSYSPSKYAVRALAESLHNEFHGLPLNIHLVCPPDTKFQISKLIYLELLDTKLKI